MSDADDREQAGTERSATGAVSSTDAAGAGEGGPQGQDSESSVCTPCHGSGKVVSNLGGESSEVLCPWCRGGGERLVGFDAQEFYAERQEQASG